MRLKHLITAFTIMGVGITMAHAQEVKQTAGRTQLGEFAPTRLYKGHAGSDKTAKRK